MKQRSFTSIVSSQRPRLRRRLRRGEKLGSCLRIEDSSLRWSDKRGFTLIELSIVLVIIGLIVGGVLVGQDLIEAAEMRSITSDIEKFEAARHTFRLKYNCLPGDCANAGTFGLGNSGNGNKYVSYTTTDNESWEYWTHLGAAGLIEGSYSGTGGNTANIGVNAPATKRQGVGFTIYNHAPAASWSSNFGVTEAQTQHLYIIGKESASWTTFDPGFTVTETYQLDQKMDDGVANTGRVRIHAFYSTCESGAAPNHAYDMSSSGLCNLMVLFNP